MSQYKSGDKVYVTGLVKLQENPTPSKPFIEKQYTEQVTLHEKNQEDGTWSTKNERGSATSNEKVYETEGEFNEWRTSPQHDTWLTSLKEGRVWYITKYA